MQKSGLPKFIIMLVCYKNKIASLFHRKAKAILWKHQFFLFSESYINKNANYRYQKDVLYKVCLAKKVYEFDNMDANAKEIQDVLYFIFPKLQNAGVLVLCKCLPNSRNLVASQVAWVSSQRLRDSVGSFCTYIHPLQKNLDLSVAVDLQTGVRDT